MRAAPIKAFFISLAVAVLVSGLVVPYAKSDDLANCARIREVPGSCGKKSAFTEVYVDNMHKDRTIRATVRKHSQEGDDDTDYAIAEGGRLLIGCVDGSTSFTVVGCEVLKGGAKKGDER